MDAVGFVVAPAPSPAKHGLIYKGMSVAANPTSWDSPRAARRSSHNPQRTTLGRATSLQVSVVSPALVDAGLGSSPAHIVTFPHAHEDERTRRRRRRHSEHPHLWHQESENDRPNSLSTTAAAAGTTATSASATTTTRPGPPQRPQRHPTLHLHDIDEACVAGANNGMQTRRWADTPGAAAVAAWVREQQVQAQYQFAPISPPSPPSPKGQSTSSSGFLGKVKKLMKK